MTGHASRIGADLAGIAMTFTAAPSPPRCWRTFCRACCSMVAIATVCLLFGRPGGATVRPQRLRCRTCGLRCLPRSFRSEVARILPGWRTVRLRDLAGEDRSYWIEHHPQWCPGLVYESFGPHGEKGWVLALVRRRRRQLLETVLYVRTAGGKPRITFLIRPAPATLGVISKIKPGVYNGAEGDRSEHIPFDGILFEIPGRASFIEYLDSSGNARSLQVSE